MSRIDDISLFEQAYLDCRRKEGRLLNDDLVRSLPHVPRNHPTYREWMIRRNSALALKGYLMKNAIFRILEIGCGNGWLTNFICDEKLQVTGIDINTVELNQAQRLFPCPDFLQVNILDDDHLLDSYDLIYLASSIQYFPSMQQLIHRLRNHLSSKGEIHVLDSPIYANRKQADDARKRSREYFASHESSMSKYYFHHSFEDLQYFEWNFLYDPMKVRNRFLRMLNFDLSPFPWICIHQG